MKKLSTSKSVCFNPSFVSMLCRLVWAYPAKKFRELLSQGMDRSGTLIEVGVRVKLTGVSEVRPPGAVVDLLWKSVRMWLKRSGF